MNARRPFLQRALVSLLVPLATSDTAAYAIANGSSAPAAQLSANGHAAEVRYLQHSGWLVQTPAYAFVFDYVGSLPGVPELPGGIAPRASDFGDRTVIVFITHAHEDHYSPEVFTWAAQRPAIQYVVGWPLEDRKERIHVMRPREDWSSGGVRIRTTGSTDEGVGFLVEAEGFSIYHAGDHALWIDAVTQLFLDEIAWLKTKQSAIDLAFFPVATGGCEPRSSIWKGVETAARELSPRVLFSMHVSCVTSLSLYEEFRAKVAPQLLATQVVAPTERGQRFLYAGGKVSSVQPDRPQQPARR
jgi:L-ascorbate metabolism protein UlaG (beta-lactamase superfamily)